MRQAATVSASSSPVHRRDAAVSGRQSGPAVAVYPHDPFRRYSAYELATIAKGCGWRRFVLDASARDALDDACAVLVAAPGSVRQRPRRANALGAHPRGAKRRVMRAVCATKAALTRSCPKISRRRRMGRGLVSKDLFAFRPAGSWPGAEPLPPGCGVRMRSSAGGGASRAAEPSRRRARPSFRLLRRRFAGRQNLSAPVPPPASLGRNMALRYNRRNRSI